MKKILVLVVAVVLIAAGGWFYHQKKNRSANGVPPKQGEFEEFLQKRGEAGLQRQSALALAVVYEGMLQRDPQNIELKRKLIETYEQAGETEKAKRLSDEVNKKAPSP